MKYILSNRYLSRVITLLLLTVYCTSGRALIKGIKKKRRKGRSIPILYLLLLFTLSPFALYAQSLNVQVIVPEPPPAYWDAYLEFNADIRIIVTNVSREAREIKLVPNLTSDRGLTARFTPEFQPLTPITIPGGGTVNLTYRDLGAIFGRPTEADVELTGIDFDRLYESETIPEGSYTLCVEARDFVTDELLSNNFGCDIFYVRQYEPPLIILPVDGTEVAPTSPQFVNFLWSTTGVPGRTRYRFRLFDLDELGLFNRADAFVLEHARPLYEQEDLVANTLAYDLGYPELIEDHHYAVQIIAYDPEGGLLFAQNGVSEAVSFYYHKVGFEVVGGGGILVNNGGEDDVPANNGPNDLNNNGPEDQLAMQFNCPPLEAPAAVPYPGTIGAMETITVGGMQMEMISGGGMSPISGTGRIFVEAFSTWVNVEFSNLAVNTELQAYGNSVVQAVDGSGLIPSGLLEDLGAGNFDPDELAESTALQLADYVSNQGNWLDPNDPGIHPALNLPAGVAGAGMELILTGMEFSSTSAIFSTFVKIELPEAQGDRRLLLIGRGMCLAAENLGEGADLLLAADKTFPLSDGVDLTFIGGEDATKVSWSANGIETFDVHGRLTFDQSLIATDGQSLMASFTAEVEDYQDWTATVSLNQEEWHLPGLEDFGLTLMPGTIVYDHSAVSSPAGFDLPGSHPLAGNENLWQGVYIPGLNFSFPEGIDAEVELEDIILDQQGAWLDVEINSNFLPFADGADIGNWPLALNQLTLDIRASSVENAGFGGRLRLPISETAVDFNAPIGGDGNFSFAVSLQDALEVDMWVASLDLAPNSSIGVSKQGDTYLPEAVLNGELAIGWAKGDGQANSAVGDFSLPGIAFENFTITGGPGVPQLSGSFGLDLEDVGQGGLANFPFQLNGVDVALNGPNTGITFDMGLKLTQMANGFEGGTVFTVNGEWDGGLKRFKYKNTQLNEISVDANVGVMSLAGAITFYDGDPIYGDGFDGAVTITVNPIQLEANMQLMVGKKPAYRYFMIDASIKLGAAAIPLGPSGLALQGFGGGFYMNMDRQFDQDQAWTINDATGTMDNPDLGPERGSGGSGAVYVPDNDKFGFSAKVIFSTIGLPSTLNADVGFGMELSNEFSLGEIWMEGNAYVMQDMADRDGDPLISGSALLTMAPNQGLYTFGGNLQANILGFLQLDIPIECYYSPTNWHFYLGKWTPMADPNDYDYSTDPGRFKYTAGFDFQVASVQTGTYGYFMMGTDLPSGLPPKPMAIRNIFNTNNAPLPSANLPEFLTTSKGFAFGMVNDFHLKFDVLIFKLSVDYIMGLDILMENKAGQECNYDEFGINQWYGRGQAYAYLGIKGAVGGKIFGKYREFVFAEIEAAAALDFKGPKPVWIKGQAAIKGKVLGGIIEFNTQVEFEHGKQVVCTGGGSNIFDDIPIVQDFDPRDGVENKSVFIHPQIAFNFPRGSFGIEEASDTPGEPITRYYGYEIVNFKVRTKEQGGSWKNHSGGAGTPDYDNAGYSCSYDLPQQLPEFSQVEVEITVRGLQLNSDDITDVDEAFSSQSYKATFTTGEAPDYILPNSIDQARPFHRQKFFQEDEVAGGGFFNFWVEQSNNLFRQSPGPNDGFDANGNYNYVVRFIDVESGTHVDRTPVNKNTGAGGGFNFAIPRGFLQPERIYKIDLLRLFQPPAVDQDDNTNVVMTNLGVDGPGPGPGGGGGGGILVNPGNQGGGGNSGGGLVIQGQLLNQQAPNAGLIQMAQFQGGGPANQLGVNNGQPDPDPPAPNFPTQIQGNDGGGPNPPWINPGLGFQVPGGSMDGLKYAARNIKERGKVDQVIVKSLMPPSQPYYFRTSKFNTSAQKLGATSVKNFASPKFQTHLIDTDNLHAFEDGVEVKVPYVFLESDEGFDRFETQYYKIHWVVTDLGDQIDSKWSSYKPKLDIQGREDWRSDEFLTEGSGGLLRPPFDYNDNAWCSENFYDPDDQFNEAPIQEWNPPLHSGNPTVTPWWAYQAAAPDEMDFADQRRYRYDAPFGKRTNRYLPAPSEANGYEYQLATIEFLQHSYGSLPNSLNGFSAQKINTYLTPGEVDAVLPPVPPDLGGGSLTLNGFQASSINGGNTPSFTLNNDGGIQIGSGQYASNDGGSRGGGGGGIPNFPGGSPQYQAGPSFIPMVDFTEWMTYKDYILYRQLVDDGVFELADLSETMPGQSLQNFFNADIYCNDDNLPLPNHFSYNSPDPGYNFYRRYYLPIRAYFKLGGVHDYFPYPARPAGEGFFRINSQNFNYQTPLLND